MKMLEQVSEVVIDDRAKTHLTAQAELQRARAGEGADKDRGQEAEAEGAAGGRVATQHFITLEVVKAVLMATGKSPAEDGGGRRAGWRQRGLGRWARANEYDGADATMDQVV